MLLPDEAAEKIATFSHEWGRVRNDGAYRAQKRCVCGVCVSQGQPSTTCTMLDGRNVVRRHTEICKTLCLSRYPLQMLCKFLRVLLAALAARATIEDYWFGLSMQEDDAPSPKNQSPHLLSAYFEYGSLSLNFLLEHIRDEQRESKSRDIIQVRC